MNMVLNHYFRSTLQNGKCVLLEPRSKALYQISSFSKYGESSLEILEDIICYGVFEHTIIECGDSCFAILNIAFKV